MAKVTVSNTATKIVGFNEKRVSLILQNLGSVTVYFGPDSSIVAGQEPFLLQDGSLEEDTSGGRNWRGDIYGITASGTSDVVYWERSSA